VKKIVKNKFNLISIVIGISTYFFIFGIDFFFSKTTFFLNMDHPVVLTGYLAFINDSWHFPLGVTNNIWPGYNFSIVWTDSIPIYSIVLKIIYTIFGIKLSNPFPLWYFICYLLFAYFTGKIIQLKTTDLPTYIFATLLIVNTPLMLNRMIHHSGLSAHWLIVSAIYFYILNKENDNKNLVKFAVYIGLSIYVHPYIFTIVFPIYFVTIASEYLKSGFSKIKNSLITLIGFFTFYFVGILSSIDFQSSSFRASDYIKYRAEFNSFFCGEIPNALISEVLWCFRPYTSIDKEGYAYIGIGFIFLLIFLPINIKKVLKNIRENLFLTTTLSLMVIYSFGNIWKISHVQLFEFQPTYLHNELLEIFRAVGRYTWGFYYFLCIYLILNVLKIRKKKISMLILLVTVSLQLYEMENIYSERQTIFRQFNPPEEQIQLAQKIYTEDGEHMLYVLGDERCTYPEYDHYIVALKYLEYGGVVYGTRTSRIKFDYQFCENYNIEKSLNTYRPYHFLINEIEDFIDTSFKDDYVCEVLPSYIDEKSSPAYCKLKVPK